MSVIIVESPLPLSKGLSKEIDNLTPDIYGPPSRFFNPEFDHLPTNIPSSSTGNRTRLIEETSMFLGLFSLAPLFLIIEEWAILPVLVLCGFAFRAVQRLHRDGIEAAVLHLASWMMLMLGICTFLLYQPFALADLLVPFHGLIYSVSLFGIVLMPMSALLALMYGMDKHLFSVKQITGITAALLNGTGWVILFIYIGLTGVKI